MNDRALLVEAEFELDPDPDALKAAEDIHARILLDAIVGKTIATVTLGRDRATIATTDGCTLIFCGFGGMKRPRGA